MEKVQKMDDKGIEPLTYRMRSERSTPELNALEIKKFCFDYSEEFIVYKLC